MGSLISRLKLNGTGGKHLSQVLTSCFSYVRHRGETWALWKFPGKGVPDEGAFSLQYTSESMEAGTCRDGRKVYSGMSQWNTATPGIYIMVKDGEAKKVLVK